MPNIAEFDTIKVIVEKAATLSPASIRFVRARLLELTKGASPTGRGAPDPDVAAAQEKTAGLFRKKVEGE